MIEARNVTKVFGLRPVLRGVDLSVGHGEFLALFGPNGAGKTTFLRILATLARPTGGSISIAGRSLPAEATAVRSLIGVVLHQPLVYGDLTAEENLHFYARLYALDGAKREARLREMLVMVGLSKRAGDLVRTFSRGMQQRLSIARAILHDPPVLLLDEPYTGLDQAAAATLDEVLQKVAKYGHTILMTTHDIQRGLSLANRVAILSKGVITYQSPTGTIDPITFAGTYRAMIG